MDTEKTIDELQLHEAITVDVSFEQSIIKMIVMRVPGGLLYQNRDLKTQTFVPYDFKKKVIPGQINNQALHNISR